MTRRLVLAALAGAATAGFWLLLVMAVLLWIDKGPCDIDSFECLGQGIAGLASTIPLALLAAWPILYLLQVRPALRVALIAVPVLAVLGFAAYLTVFQRAPQLTAVVTSAAAYAVAAWIGAPRNRLAA